MNHDTERQLEAIMNDSEGYTVETLMQECGTPLLMLGGLTYAIYELDKKPVFMSISDELLDYSLRGLEALKV